MMKTLKCNLVSIAFHYFNSVSQHNDKSVMQLPQTTLDFYTLILLFS